MTGESEQEKKNKRIALLSTIGVHTVILLLMFFAIAWRAPDPPLPEYGIELNFGMDTQGSGDIQPDAPVGTEKVQPDQMEESQPEESEPQEKEEDVPEETKPTETKPVEEQVTTKQESPVVVKEKEVKKEEVKPIEKPKEKVEEKKVEEKPKAVYNPDNTKTTEKTTVESKEGKPGNQGDDKGKTGDKGSPQGKPDANAMYGKAGGGDGGGSALDLNGWDWDNIPKPNVADNETGRIVYEIEVDENGELIKYKKESGSLSAASEKACVEAIQKLTFTKKSGAKVPPISKGKITFVVRSQ